MPTINTVARIVTTPLPRMLSPKAHAFVDYCAVGAFLGSALWFWKKNKRASLAALICGGAELAVSLLTDYPGGIKKVIDFRTHRDIDFGLAAMAATMPEFLAFEDDAEKSFFTAQGLVITAANQVTQFPEKPEKHERPKEWRRRAA